MSAFTTLRDVGISVREDGGVFTYFHLGVLNGRTMWLPDARNIWRAPIPAPQGVAAGMYRDALLAGKPLTGEPSVEEEIYRRSITDCWSRSSSNLDHVDWVQVIDLDHEVDFMTSRVLATSLTSTIWTNPIATLNAQVFKADRRMPTTSEKVELAEQIRRRAEKEARLRGLQTGRNGLE